MLAECSSEYILMYSTAIDAMFQGIGIVKLKAIDSTGLLRIYYLIASTLLYNCNALAPCDYEFSL